MNTKKMIPLLLLLCLTGCKQPEDEYRVPNPSQLRQDFAVTAQEAELPPEETTPQSQDSVVTPVLPFS